MTIESKVSSTFFTETACYMGQKKAVNDEKKGCPPASYATGGALWCEG